MQSTGVLVHAWPIVLGCDASGTVVSVGSAVTKFKEGDGVFGCTRLGVPGYGTFQEYVCPRPSLVLSLILFASRSFEDATVIVDDRF